MIVSLNLSFSSAVAPSVKIQERPFPEIHCEFQCLVLPADFVEFILDMWGAISVLDRAHA